MRSLYLHYLDVLQRWLQSLAPPITAWCRDHGPEARQALAVAGLYLAVVGIGDVLLEHLLLAQSRALFPLLTPVFKPQAPTIYAELIDYLAVAGALIGAIVLADWRKTLPVVWGAGVALTERLALPTLAIALTLAAAVTAPLAKAFFVLSVIASVVRLLLGPRTDLALSPRMARLAGAGSLLVVLTAAGIMAAAWYPVRLTNDYIEASDRVVLPPETPGGAPTGITMTRAQAIDCLKALDDQRATAQSGEDNVLSDRDRLLIAGVLGAMGNGSAMRLSFSDLRVPRATETGAVDCLHPLSEVQASRMREALQTTGAWQSEPGRTLYHHAYVFVPAMHLLKYGLSSPIPYLYGFGNTAFHALLMAADPDSLTRYFETFPIAQLVGLVVIVGAVGLMADSLVPLPAALALALIAYAHIGFETVQLASGFSPLRYAGLALQMVSIVWMLRRPSWATIVGLLVALAASLLWNKEFGIIGLAGQILALNAPELRIKPVERVLLVAGALGIVTGALFALSVVSNGFLATIQVGFFRIAMPTIDGPDFTRLSLAVIGSGIVLFGMSRRFEGVERRIRLCLIPVLGVLMIKFLYYYAAIHFWLTMAFVLPMVLVFLDWGRLRQGGSVQAAASCRTMLTSIVIVCVALTCLIEAVRYTSAAHQRDDIMIAPFVTGKWQSLGETFTTTTPAALITQRVAALRSVLQPNDTVLLLSPFDHLLAFYANPQRYCGHFDNVTNLVTYRMIEDVAACARQAPHALIVTDAALETPCPTDWRRAYVNTVECSCKRALMQSVKAVFNALRPDLVLVKTDGPLSFYRMRDERLRVQQHSTDIRPSSGTSQQLVARAWYAFPPQQQEAVLRILAIAVTQPDNQEHRRSQLMERLYAPRLAY